MEKQQEEVIAIPDIDEDDFDIDYFVRDGFNHDHSCTNVNELSNSNGKQISIVVDHNNLPNWLLLNPRVYGNQPQYFLNLGSFPYRSMVDKRLLVLLDEKPNPKNDWKLEWKDFARNLLKMCFAYKQHLIEYFPQGLDSYERASFVSAIAANFKQLSSTYSYYMNKVESEIKIMGEDKFVWEPSRYGLSEPNNKALPTLIKYLSCKLRYAFEYKNPHKKRSKSGGKLTEVTIKRNQNRKGKKRKHAPENKDNTIQQSQIQESQSTNTVPKFVIKNEFKEEVE